MDVNKIFDIINYVGEITSSGKVAIAVFIELSISILVMFGLRVILIFKTAGIHFLKEKKYRKQKGIILNHIGIEIIIAFILSFLLLLMINTTSDNLIINMIVAPLLGQLVAIFIDDKWFAQKDYESIYGIKDHTTHSLADLVNVQGDITQEVIDSEDFRPIVAKTINQIREKQDEQEKKIDSTIDILTKLLESEKNEKRVSLKKQMYDCLANGYVKPAERERIESEYNDYRQLLNGNHDVQQLYENHYSKLSVHEDRRKQNREVANDRRQEKRNCEYGQFDTPISEDKP